MLLLVLFEPPHGAHRLSFLLLPWRPRVVGVGVLPLDARQLPISPRSKLPTHNNPHLWDRPRWPFICLCTTNTPRPPARPAQQVFEWALANFYRAGDTIHVLHIIPPARRLVVTPDLGLEGVIEDDEETRAQMVGEQRTIVQAGG